MPDAHDPAALVRHAEQAGDWRLVGLITDMLSGRASEHSPGRHGTYATLVVKLGLAADRSDYDRA